MSVADRFCRLAFSSHSAIAVYTRLHFLIATAPVTARHRISRTRNCLSRATFLGMAFEPIEAAEQSWWKIRGVDKIELLLKGLPFKDGTPVIESTPAPQPLVA
ncbi:hypothetical protein [Burkholderia ubonensis]|uniref:hypothetical protein n=1 Tax=Burkholderia ubonensis TaxID=101571 RepID=UPI000AABBCD9